MESVFDIKSLVKKMAERRKLLVREKDDFDNLMVEKCNPNAVRCKDSGVEEYSNCF